MEQEEGSCICPDTPGVLTHPVSASGVSTLDEGVEYLTITVPAVHSEVALLRRRVIEFALSCPLSTQDLADVELAVGEACSNALKHGSPHEEQDLITIRCRRTDSDVAFEVSDSGPGFDPGRVPVPMAEDLNEGGMGIFVMRSVMDSIEFTFNHGTTVHLHKQYSRG
jgi:serine/threonine-protein kinase RsbW